MGSTARSVTQASPLPAAAALRWRSWPLVDCPHWSWVMLLGILLVSVSVFWLGGGWLLPVVAGAALAAALWQFLLPITFDVCPLGLRRYALRRVRLVPWQAIRAYQLRSTGIVFFQRPDPTEIDHSTSLFVPYPPDEDELLIAVRLYLSHAVELPG